MNEIELIDQKSEFIFTEIGLKILKARKQSRKKIDTISKTLKIKSGYLLAIENGKYNLFPEEVYLKGFIKSYAGYLGVDISSELNMLDNHYRKEKEKNKKNNQHDQYSEAVPNYSIFFIVFFTFIIIIFAWYEYQKVVDKNYGFSDIELDQGNVKDDNYSKEKEESTNKKIDVVASLIKKEGKQILKEEPFSIGEIKNINIQDNIYQKENISIHKEIRLEFFDETWIQVRDINELITESGIYKSGETMSLKINEINTNYFIDTGNSGGFRIVLNNKEYPILGDEGEVKKNVSLLDFFEKFNSIQEVD